jgi:hypothetical protein
MPPAKKMSSAHKAALAKGRAQANAVRAYLEALDANRPRRGRKRTPASIEKRIAEIDREYETASVLRALNLLQERRNLEDELDRLLAADQGADLDKLRRGFVKNARAYAAAKGIEYATWREAGVPADALRDAGITRGSGAG